jgi:uncharacterized protein YjiS (DUF1127 family)
MHTRVAKEELAILLPNTMSHYFQDEPAYTAEPEVKRSGLFAHLRAALRWIAEIPKRQAVMDELSMLSDHELADIGLNRTELRYVFDPAFAADRAAQRDGSRAFAGRTASAF